MHVPSRVIRPHSTVHSTCVASATLPTKHGDFETHVFRDAPVPSGGSSAAPAGSPSGEHVALVYGDVADRTSVPVRVHSECMTSEVFGSLKCDCRDQLDASMAEIARRGAGAILYLRQEGRGIGLINKIRAYDLQSRGHDTVDANRLLGLPDDARGYEVARDMLDHLRIKSVRVMTNNPDKIEKLRALGVVVTGRLPVIVAATPHSIGYLEAKRLRMAHELPARPALDDLLPAASGDAE